MGAGGMHTFLVEIPGSNHGCDVGYENETRVWSFMGIRLIG